MSWHVGVFPLNTAGLLVAELDALLVTNAFWTVFDTPAANVRVYCCSDVPNNCLFYVYIDNTAAGIGVVQLWEGWNAGGHVGVGASLTFIGASVALKMNYGAGGYALSLRDHRIVWTDWVSGRAVYIGQPRRLNSALNIVVFCGSGNVPLNNSLSTPGNQLGNAWASLFDELGNRSYLGFSGSTGGATFVVKTIQGELQLRETPLYNTVTGLIMGELEGVASYGAAGIAGIVTADTCVMPGGNTWIAAMQGGLSFQEEA